MESAALQVITAATAIAQPPKRKREKRLPPPQVAPPIWVAPARYVTIELAESCTGYSQDAIRSKIARKDWLEGREYVKAPDGRTLVDLRGFEKWVEG